MTDNPLLPATATSTRRPATAAPAQLSAASTRLPAASTRLPAASAQLSAASTPIRLASISTQLSAASAHIASASARLGGTKLVLIDGHSGAGKTTFAERLSRSVGGELVHTDDLLDGWDDQFTYWKGLVRNVFDPISAGRLGGYWRYDWAQEKFIEWVPVKPAPILIVEGVGVARAEGRALASLTVFIATPGSVREARSLARDGEAMQAQLARWRRREDLHFGADATAWCADMVIASADGGSP